MLIINPLKETLAHYEEELTDTLSAAGYHVHVTGTVRGDRVEGAVHRIGVALRTIWERYRLARNSAGQTIIVTWPLFGYLEPLTLARLARNNEVFIIIHDPTPLRRTYGQSVWARWLFRQTVRRHRIQVLYHTASAQREGIRLTGVEGLIAAHPVQALKCSKSATKTPASRPVVRVLGQHKDTRSLDALLTIADRAAGSCQLEIYGSGWPAVDGWAVQNRFLLEDEFTSLLRSSDCVVIPYDTFFQSGVAVRCLENGIPIAAPQHEHICELFGAKWPGIVSEAEGWYDAVIRAIGADRAYLQARRQTVIEETRLSWRTLLDGTRRPAAAPPSCE